MSKVPGISPSNSSIVKWTVTSVDLKSAASTRPESPITAIPLGRWGRLAMRAMKMGRELSAVLVVAALIVKMVITAFAPAEHLPYQSPAALCYCSQAARLLCQFPATLRHFRHSRTAISHHFGHSMTATPLFWNIVNIIITWIVNMLVSPILLEVMK